MKILEVRVDEVGRQEAIDKISYWIEKKGGLKQVVTIYSEFLLAAEHDDRFREAVEKADLVVPDGVGVLAAMEYKQEISNFKFQISNFRRVIMGLRVGLKGLRGRLGKPVTGVWLFEELVRLAAGKGWRVFLLGGFGDTAERLVRKLHQTENKRQGTAKLQIEWDAGEQKVGESEKENGRVVEKINEFKPDLLFVAYGPISQEKWIYKNKRRLKAKVAIGVGGTFDEVLGEFPKAPKWMEKRGLKALWRLMVQPKRLFRIWRGMVVFPWRVFRSNK